MKIYQKNDWRFSTPTEKYIVYIYVIRNTLKFYERINYRLILTNFTVRLNRIDIGKIESVDYTQRARFDGDKGIPEEASLIWVALLSSKVQTLMPLDPLIDK